jgi:hypothetical protein
MVKKLIYRDGKYTVMDINPYSIASPYKVLLKDPYFRRARTGGTRIVKRHLQRYNITRRKVRRDLKMSQAERNYINSLTPEEAAKERDRILHELKNQVSAVKSQWAKEKVKEIEVKLKDRYMVSREEAKNLESELKASSKSTGDTEEDFTMGRTGTNEHVKLTKDEMEKLAKTKGVPVLDVLWKNAKTDEEKIKIIEGTDSQLLDENTQKKANQRMGLKQSLGNWDFRAEKPFKNNGDKGNSTTSRLAATRDLLLTQRGIPKRISDGLLNEEKRLDNDIMMQKQGVSEDKAREKHITPKISISRRIAILNERTEPRSILNQLPKYVVPSIFKQNLIELKKGSVLYPEKIFKPEWDKSKGKEFTLTGVRKTGFKHPFGPQEVHFEPTGIKDVYFTKIGDNTIKAIVKHEGPDKDVLKKIEVS